jgi:hypothetical protein
VSKQPPGCKAGDGRKCDRRCRAKQDASAWRNRRAAGDQDAHVALRHLRLFRNQCGAATLANIERTGGYEPLTSALLHAEMLFREKYDPAGAFDVNVVARDDRKKAARGPMGFGCVWVFIHDNASEELSVVTACVQLLSRRAGEQPGFSQQREACEKRSIESIAGRPDHFETLTAAATKALAH